MIENFKNWISALLCIGIFISILELILPKSKIKKYIYVLVGIVTTITIVAPGINLLKNDNIAQSVSAVAQNLSENVNINSDSGVENDAKSQQTMVKEEFINTFKKDVEAKLTLKGITVQEVYVIVNDNYDIQKIQVKVNKLSGGGLNEVSKVVEYINSEYDIDYSKIEVIESGD